MLPESTGPSPQLIIDQENKAFSRHIGSKIYVQKHAKVASYKGESGT